MSKTVEELEAENHELRAQLANATHLDPYVEDVEVTVGILACNAWQYLGHILPPLPRQGLRLDVLTYVDSKSFDATHEILASERTQKWLLSHNAKTIREYRFLGELPHRPMEQILAWSKGNFVSEARTKYLFFLDADVKLPPGGILHALEELKSDPKAGVIGIPYDKNVDHVEQGAIIMERELAKKLKFWHHPSCVCRNLAKSVHGVGLQMRHWKRPERAEHVKWLSSIILDELAVPTEATEVE